MIKLIACDLDGTLVNNSHQISKENVEAIEEAQKQGIEFIVSTGRTFDDAYNQVADVGIECNYLVMNGGELRNCKKEIIQKTYMNNNLVQEIVNKLKIENLYVELYTDKGIFSVSNIEQIKYAVAVKINFFFPSIKISDAIVNVEQHEQYKKIKQLNDISEIWEMGAVVGKILSFSDDSLKLERMRNEIPELYNANCTGSFPINLEITDMGASKGEALKRYAKSKGIDDSQIMTIGDSFNDFSMMLDEFGVTVAMKNATEEIKKVAKFETASNDDNGVAIAIAKILNKRWTYEDK